MSIINFNTEKYRNAYILVRGDITVIAAPATLVAFKDCAPFAKFITKMMETQQIMLKFRFSNANVQSNRI